MNTITRIATNIINRIVNEDTTMYTNNALARLTRRAVALFAFTGMLAVSHQAAKADIVIERWVGTSQAYNVPVGSTNMQFKVRNTDPYTVSGIHVYTILWTPGLRDVTTPASNAFSLAPYEAKWVNVLIPASGS